MQNCITLQHNKSQKSINKMELVQDAAQRPRYTERQQMHLAMTENAASV